MEFIQIIEFTTSRIDELESVLDAWVLATEGKRKARRGTLTVDRDRPNVYVQIVEFPSHEEAMENSNLPETGVFAQRITELCDAPLSFRNLDVRRVEQFG